MGGPVNDSRTKPEVSQCIDPTAGPERTTGLGFEAGAAFAGALALYWVTLAPDMLWSDSAKLALYVHRKVLFGIDYHLHPLHTWVGIVFARLPWPLARTQNFMSAVFGASTVALVYGWLRTLTKHRLPAVAAAASLAVSHLFWLYAVINETYSMIAFFLVLCGWIAHTWQRDSRVWKLYVLALTLGLAYAVHGMAVLWIPGFLVMIWNREVQKKRMFIHIPGLAFAFLAGAFPITLAPLLAGLPPGEWFPRFLAATRGAGDVFLGDARKLVRELVRYPFYLAYQFPTPAWFVGGFGLFKFARWNKNRLAAGWAVLAATMVVFSSLYFFQREFPMLIPTFVVFSLFVGLGTAALQERGVFTRRRIFPMGFVVLCLILPPGVYALTSRVMESLRIPLPVRQLPYRNSYRYFLFPPKNGEDGAYRYMRDAFDQVSPGAWILADFNPGMALVYGQEVLGFRPDVEVDIRVDAWVHNSPDPTRSILGYLQDQVIRRGRSVYLADDWEPYYHTRAVKRVFELTRDGGPLWRVRPRAASGPS